MKTRIHVNQHHIKWNQKGGKPEKDVFSIKTYKETVTANKVHIEGPSTLVYKPDKPLSCGAKAWIETECLVIAIGELDENN